MIARLLTLCMLVSSCLGLSQTNEPRPLQNRKDTSEDRTLLRSMPLGFEIGEVAQLTADIASGEATAWFKPGVKNKYRGTKGLQGHWIVPNKAMLDGIIGKLTQGVVMRRPSEKGKSLLKRPKVKHPLNNHYLRMTLTTRRAGVPAVVANVVFLHGTYVFAGGLFGKKRYWVRDTKHLEELILRNLVKSYGKPFTKHQKRLLAEFSEVLPENFSVGENQIGPYPDSPKLMLAERELLECIAWREKGKHWTFEPGTQERIGNAITEKINAFEKKLVAEAKKPDSKDLYKVRQIDSDKPDNKKFKRKPKKLEEVFLEFSEKWDKKHPLNLPERPENDSQSDDKKAPDQPGKQE